jgi:hypothetical protein
MDFFNASAGANSWTWIVTTTNPGSSPAAAVFKYDPSMVPPGVFGGFGTLTSSENGGRTDPFTWVGANGVLTWQLTNQHPNIETKTTYFGIWDGNVTLNGNMCNYNINFNLSVMSAVYQGSNP